MLKHIDDVGMLQRNHPLETGIRLNLDRVVAKEQRQEEKGNQDDGPIVEDQPFQERFCLRCSQVMLALVVLRVRHSKAPLIFYLLVPHQGVIEDSCRGRRCASRHPRPQLSY